MKSILKQYVGQKIAINYKSPGSVGEATLTEVGDDYIVVFADDTTFYFPISCVLQISIPQKGVVVGGPLLDRKKAAVGVTVQHLVIYKGALGISWPV